MITIAAHGVPQLTDTEFAPAQLSPMQYRLLTDPAPIRICGAPTGAGKTYAFLQSIHTRHHWVLFVVPTQALAANIAQTAHLQQLDAVVWDSSQHDRLIQSGRNVWIERIQEVDRMIQSGGLVITTPETLGQIFLGVPYRHVRPEMDLTLLLSAAHIVFDEVHLLTERALGFLQAWMTLIGGQDLYGHPKARLTLLSATHSDLLRPLVGMEIPNTLVSTFDEEVTTLAEGFPAPNLRLLHGTVTIRIGAGTLPDLLHDHLEDLLSRHARVLVVFDSLKQYSHQAVTIEREVIRVGLTPDQVFVVTGQDRQAGVALDGVHFVVGIHPTSHHRLIIGTSALEVGITYPNVTAAVIDPGLTPAALIQRIGRVARGDHSGEVIVATPPHTVPSHFVTLQQLEERVWTAEDFRKAFTPYVPIHWGRARALGSAYWSMMHQTHAPADQALRALHGAMSTESLPGSQMNQLRHEAAELKPNTRRLYLRWLATVDRILQDIRGFSPTISLQFPHGGPVTYARDWALRYLRDPDHIDIERNCWMYDRPRDQCLLDNPRIITARLLLPTRVESSMVVTLYPGPQAYGKALEQYMDKIRQSPEFAYHPIWEHTCRFIAATGLLIWDVPETANLVDIPDIDGSLSI